MKTNENQAPQGARPIFWLTAITIVVGIGSLVAFHATKHVRSSRAENVQAHVVAVAPAMPKVYQQVTSVASAPQPVQTNDPMVVIDQGGSVTFSTSKKVQPLMVTEKQVLAMQEAARLAAATNKQ